MSDDGVARVLGRLAHHAEVQVAQVARGRRQEIAPAHIDLTSVQAQAAVTMREASVEITEDQVTQVAGGRRQEVASARVIPISHRLLLTTFLSVALFKVVRGQILSNI